MFHLFFIDIVGNPILFSTFAYRFRSGGVIGEHRVDAGSNPVLTTKIKIMKKILKEFHQSLVEGCHPLDPTIVYIFCIIVLVYSLIQVFY